LNTLNGTDDFFVKTDQLDGETDWKQKKCIQFTYNKFNQEVSRDKFFFENDYKNYSFECEKPSKEIYKFSGRMTYKDILTGEEKHEGIDIDKCIWANTKVTSGAVYAFVIYTGWQTRMQMNMTNAGFKLTKIDIELNFLMFVILILMCLLALNMVLNKGFDSYSFIFFIRYIVMFS